MKRYGNLYDKIISMDNLILAERHARRGIQKKEKKSARHRQLSWLGYALQQHKFIKNNSNMKIISDYKPEQVVRATETTNFFHWNMEEITVNDYSIDGEATETKKWQADCVEVDGEPTFDKVFIKVIREKYSESEEFALVNAYNAHVTGIKEDDAKVEEYKAMLAWRQEKKDELKALFA